MPLKKVTVTGADDSVRPAALLEIANRFPFVEFGILVGQDHFGSPRFPSAPWIAEFVEAFHGRPGQVSMHLCGEWVRDFYMGRPLAVGQFPAALLHAAGRVQLNTHGVLHEYELSGMMTLIGQLNQVGIEVIFQYDEINVIPLETAAHGGLKVSALVDGSHGAGILPAAWPAPEDTEGDNLEIPIGYAGGLTPENVADQIYLMPQDPPGAPTWVDAETHLRASEGMLFDLTKVERFLAAAMPWVE